MIRFLSRLPSRDAVGKCELVAGALVGVVGLGCMLGGTVEGAPATANVGSLAFLVGAALFIAGAVHTD